MPKFSSNAISEHVEVPLADEGQLEELVAYWNERRAGSTRPEKSQSYVASIGAERDCDVRGAQLAEIVALVQSQGGKVVGQEICHLSSPNARTLLGKGMAQELAVRARACGATLLVLDAELSPSQTRNLEDAAGMPVCDREAIILNVFLRHARSRRAKVQVEIAQLEYLRPRIRGVGLDMDQQMGGMSRARGPGETGPSSWRASWAAGSKTEGNHCERSSFRRHAAASACRVQERGAGRLHECGQDLAHERASPRPASRRAICRSKPRHDLALSHSPRVRGAAQRHRRFHSSLARTPARHFESTLVEIREAALLVVVVDVADYERELQVQTTIKLLERLESQNIPRFYVFNKADRLTATPDGSELERCSDGRPWALLSSQDPVAIAELKGRLLQAARGDEADLTVFVPYAASETMALIYANCRVMRSDAEEAGLRIRLRGSQALISRIRSGLEAARCRSGPGDVARDYFTARPTTAALAQSG